MRQFYNAILLTTALSHLCVANTGTASLDAADTSVSSLTLGKADTTLMKTNEAFSSPVGEGPKFSSVTYIKPTPIESVMAVAKGRYSYNESLRLMLEDLSLTIEDRLAEYKALTDFEPPAGVQLCSQEEQCTTSISQINGDLYKYEFIINMINEINKITCETRKHEEISVLYALIKSLYKIDEDEAKGQPKHFKASGYYELEFLKEMADVFEPSDILPCYSFFPSILSFGHEGCVGIMQWEKESHISYLKNKMKMSKSISVIEDYKRTNGASMSGDLKRREKLLVKKFDDTVKDIDDRSDKCFREIQSSGVSADFSDLTKAERLIRDYSIKFYELNNLLLQGNKTLSSIFDCYKEIFKEVNEISAAKLARKKQNEEQKREAEKRQRERDQLRKESYDAFMTEQRRLKAEGAQQAEQRRVAATAERKSKETKKDATEANDQSDLTQSATASQIVESVPSYERTGEKVKTRGVAAPIAASAAGQEVVPPQVAVIPEHIQTFVSEIIDADFETVKDRFEKEIAAEVILRSNNKYVFSFRSPINNEFIKFYADNPHGAQLKKFHTAWRGRMIDALVLAGMKVR